MFQIFDLIVTRLPTPMKAPSTDAVQCCLNVLEVLRDFEHRRDIDRRDIYELKELLNRTHFKVGFCNFFMIIFRPVLIVLF